MKKNNKKIIMSLVCAVFLMAHAVTAYAAECDCGCKINDCVHIEDFKTPPTYSPNSGMTHTATWYQINSCSKCLVYEEQEMSATEPCQWIKYDDLGHQSDGHKYRLTCGLCHGTYDITLSTCPGKITGEHITPW